MKKIKRISSYSDHRFEKEVLNQHGAYIIDDEYKCSFKIIDEKTAIVDYDEGINLDEVIDEFRFYTEYITSFYDKNMKLIKSFKPVDTFKINIADIQPSQFLVDQDKVEAISTFITKEDDIFISLSLVGDKYVSCDGHTRLYYATTMNFKTVNGFISDPGDYLEEFAEEARKKQVYSPYDLKQVSHDEYKVRWHKFCDDFFESRK